MRYFDKSDSRAGRDMDGGGGSQHRVHGLGVRYSANRNEGGDNSHRIHGFGRNTDEFNAVTSFDKYNHRRGIGGLGTAADITDTIDFEDGSQTVYYSDGGWIQYDANGNAVDTSYSAPEPYTYTGDAGNVIDRIQGTVTISTTASDVATAAANAARLPSTNSIKLPGGVSQATIDAALNKIIQAGGNAAGNWIARNVGGNTVLYRNNTAGGFGTLNVQSLLLPGILLLLILKGKK